MRSPLAVPAILFMALLCLSPPFGAFGQQQDEYICKNGNGKVRSRADLDKVLADHKLWIDSKAGAGAQADLRWAQLDRADLSFANLSDANLYGAHLAGADLSRAHLEGSSLDCSHLAGADLTGAYLNGADLSYADLRKAHFINTDMTEALLVKAKMAGAHFEPVQLPYIDIERAQGLELVTWDTWPGPLTKLRKEFQDQGYREAERKITCALNRRDAELAPPIERWFKQIAFDYTCQYGLAPGRPLWIVLWLWLFFAAVYAAFMHQPGPSGIYFVARRQWRGRLYTQGIQIRPRPVRATKWWKLSFAWLNREWRLFRAAMLFSLMSAFNIGFRDINFGTWLRMLTRHEYDLKAVGWVRTVSGFQSLFSVYLIALWVLVYFGRPFE